MGSNILETEGLSKKYAGVLRVNDLDIRIKEGEVYGFLGPNGAGKSTTMKMLLGLVKPSTGTISIFGKPFIEKNRIEILNEMGSLIESPSYYGHLSGKENMEIVRKLLDVPKSNIDEAIKIVRMENQMNKKVRYYSLGMKQRLGIAMALAGFPKLLILDEPTNGLDPAGIEEIRELIKALPQKYGMTVMISSHILSEIDQVASSIGIINHGELIFQERKEALENERKPYITIRTSDMEKTCNVLNIQKPKGNFSELNLGILSDEAIGKAIYTLNNHNIMIYRIEEHRRSLEDIFLELTGQELTL